MKSTVVLGNPGTGKTFNVINEVDRLIKKGHPPEDIYLVSHTKAAAREIVSRCKEKVNASTIHSLAFKVADINRDQVVRQKEISNWSNNKLGVPMKPYIDASTESMEIGDEYLQCIELSAARMIDPIQMFKSSSIMGGISQFEHYLRNYANWKSIYGFVDFIDMIKMAMESNNCPKISALLIDEAQDLSKLQWYFILNLIEKSGVKEVVVTGDPDQSLFLWGGAMKDGMIRFARKFGSEIIELNQSYRVPKKVYKVSKKIIGRVPDRYEKDYLPTDENGSVDHYSDIGLAPIPDDDTLILYRNHSMRKEVERELLHRCVPYTALGSYRGFCHNKYANAIRVINRIKEDPFQSLNYRDTGVLKSLGTPSLLRILESKDFAKIKNMKIHEALLLPFGLDDYYSSVDVDDCDRVRISTIHGSKGMEAKNVVIVGGMMGRVVSNFDIDPGPEYQVWYVAVTRAKERLIYAESVEAGSYDILSEFI